MISSSNKIQENLNHKKFNSNSVAILQQHILECIQPTLVRQMANHLEMHRRYIAENLVSPEPNIPYRLLRHELIAEKIRHWFLFSNIDECQTSNPRLTSFPICVVSVSKQLRINSKIFSLENRISIQSIEKLIQSTVHDELLFHSRYNLIN